MSVEIDGVNNIIKADTINESTSGSGVTIDGVLIKDTTIDVNGTAGALILDTDADTKIQASTDDNIEFFTAGKKQFNLTSFGSVQAFRDSATTFGPSFNGQHQRGTIASPSIVSSGDRIAEFKSTVYDGTAYLDGPRISFRVDGTPGDDDMPTRMEFQVGADGTASLYAAMTLHNDGSLIMNPIAGAITVFNENSVDSDFRVESNGNANMLFIDGGNDRVGVGTASPATALDVNGTATVGALSDGTVTKSKIAFHLWKLAGNLSVSSGAADITANMTQVEAVGSVLSVSSGVFTFPYIGKWRIQYQILSSSSAAAAYRGGAISATTDGSNFSEIRNGFTSNTSSTYFAVDINYTFDCTNVSTHKIKFRTENAASGTISQGTNFSFTYLGDT